MVDTHSLQTGTLVEVSQNGQLVAGTFEGVNTKYNLPIIRLRDGRTILRKIKRVVTIGAQAETENLPVQAEDHRFNINTRFDFVTRMTRMIALGKARGLLLTGKGGLGKSYTVKSTLADAGLQKNDGYTLVKGYCTPVQLYVTLHNNQDGVVVFDDCDSVLQNDDSVNILKGAIDTDDDREVSWMSSRAPMGEDGEPLPKSFSFAGKIIFISNMTRDEVDEAIITRCLNVDLSMTPAEAIERMGMILPNIVGFTQSIKQMALDFLDEHKTVAKELSMRTLLKLCQIIEMNPNDWQPMAEYSING